MKINRFKEPFFAIKLCSCIITSCEDKLLARSDSILYITYKFYYIYTCGVDNLYLEYSIIHDYAVRFSLLDRKFLTFIMFYYNSTNNYNNTYISSFYSQFTRLTFVFNGRERWNERLSYRSHYLPFYKYSNKYFDIVI